MREAYLSHYLLIIIQRARLEEQPCSPYLHLFNSSGLSLSKFGLKSELNKTSSIQIAKSSFNYADQFIGFFYNSFDVVIKGKFIIKYHTDIIFCITLCKLPMSFCNSSLLLTAPYSFVSSANIVHWLKYFPANHL